MRAISLGLFILFQLACSGGDGSGDAVDAAVSCQPESDAELCQLRGAECGTLELSDRCGAAREVACGSCATGTCQSGTCVVTTGCTAECSANQVTACTCGESDPCGWSGDGYCDRECMEMFPSSHFDDTVDCPQTITESLAASCASNAQCAAELTCYDGSCECCNDAEQEGALWECHPSSVPAVALDVCGVMRASTVASKYGQDAVAHVGDGCYSGSPNNHWCPPQLQCVSRVAADEYRCGCCAEVQGSFMCSYDVAFARTFCLGLDTSCLDGSCLDCIGDACEPDCAHNHDGVCDEPEGTGLCPDNTDFSDCNP